MIPNHNPMVIGFDAKRLFKNFTGLGNYSRFILSALSNFYPENQYMLFTPSVTHHPEVQAVISKENISVVSPPFFYPSFLQSLWRTWGMGWGNDMKKLHVFHGLSQELPLHLPANVQKVVTVHDLIFLRYPQFYNPIDVKIYKAKVHHACKMADKIVAISGQTATDLVELLGVDKSKIEIVYQGCHSNFKKVITAEERQSVKTKYRLPDKYILNVGTIEERKNVLLIVKSILRIPENERVPLIIVGRKTDYTKTVEDFIRKNKLDAWVKFVHDASFHNFPAIYQGAELFIYPSRIEGFGIPLLEAMESGIPVITANSVALMEAAGPGSLIIDPDDDGALARGIQKIIQDETVRQTMVSLSLDHLKKFQPQVIADHMMRLYHTLGV